MSGGWWLGQVRRRALALAALVSVVGSGILATTPLEWLHASGPATPGHADLACVSCHEPAPGTLRQQLQATVAYWLGQRENPVGVVHGFVDSSACQDCHDRSDDRHPTYRFTESRFAEVRREHGVQDCTGCHVEHQGRRVSAPANICESCHEETAFDGDSTQPSHVELISESRWSTCLQCHDFHGNHVETVPNRLSDGIPVADVEAYLGHGPPVHGEIRTPAREERSR